jgi:hypothetical protein
VRGIRRLAQGHGGQADSDPFVNSLLLAALLSGAATAGVAFDDANASGRRDTHIQAANAWRTRLALSLVRQHGAELALVGGDLIKDALRVDEVTARGPLQLDWIRQDLAYVAPGRAAGA